jgi:1,6-anhydro-N-acetylmuramate kinase
MGIYLYICGGGAHNIGLLSALAALIAPDRVTGAKGARILSGVYRYA